MIRLGKSEREHIKFLRSKGFTIRALRRNKGHLHVLVDDKVKVTLPSTPSDKKRFMKNSVSSINKAKVHGYG